MDEGCFPSSCPLASSRSSMSFLLFVLSCLSQSQCQSAPRRLARERENARLEARLVTVRHVHAAKLGVRRHRASAGADRDERAVAAAFPRRQHVPLRRGARAKRVGPVVDVPDRLRGVAREARARVERTFRIDACRRAACGARTAPCGRRPPWGSRAVSSPRAGRSSCRRDRCSRCRRSRFRCLRPSCRCRRAAFPTRRPPSAESSLSAFSASRE